VVGTDGAGSRATEQRVISILPGVLNDLWCDLHRGVCGLKFEPIPSRDLIPPFDTVQLSEHESDQEPRPHANWMETSSPFFDLKTGTARVTVMYHDLSSLDQVSAATRGGLAPWQLKRVKSMLSAHIRKNVLLQDLADACDLSKGHFLREFKQSTGHTPHRWAVLHGVAMAAELLTNTRLPVGQVALACGFSNISHLSRWFTRVVGMGPKAWQQSRRP
jgi:AraC-like DNA-binding protein